MGTNRRQLLGPPQQKKAQAQTEENPGNVPAAAKKLQHDSKNVYAHSIAEADEVGSPPEAESLTGVARKCFDRLFEKLLPHHESRGDDPHGGKKEGDQNPRRNTAMGKFHFVDHEKEAEPGQDETSVD